MATVDGNQNGADITPDKNNNITNGSDNNATENSGSTGENNSQINYSAIVNGDLEVNTDGLSARERSNVTGCKNLVPYRERSKEEARENGAKGGIKSGETRRKKRDMMQVAKAILEHAMTEEQITEVLGSSESLLDGDKSVMAVLTARMVQEAGKGSYKHYETLRDTAGFKPKDVIGVTADIMTDADRALMEKVGRRLNVQDA